MADYKSSPLANLEQQTEEMKEMIHNKKKNLLECKTTDDQELFSYPGLDYKERL